MIRQSLRCIPAGLVVAFAFVGSADGTLASPAFAQAAKPAPSAKPAPAKPAAKPATKPAAGAAASATDPKALYASGEKKFKAGDFAGALADFDAANNVKAAPQTERYIGLCQDQLGHLPEAVASYEKFLAHVPEKMASEGDSIKKRVEAIKALPGKVKVTTKPEGASLVVDGKPAEKPAPTELELAPGKHTIAAVLEGREKTEREIEVAYASKADLALELPEKAAPPPVAVVPPVEAPKEAPPPAPPPEPRSKVPAYITAGVAVVAAGVGTAFGLVALSKHSDYEKNPTSDTADSGENAALIADMCFGVAVTFGVTSAVLFLTDGGGSSAKNTTKPSTAKSNGIRITPTPYVTPNGAGAGALVRF